MTLVLLVPDGVGIRNFVLGGFARRAAVAGPTAVLHVASDALLPIYRAATGPELEWHPLLPPQPARVAETLASAAGYAHMYWACTHAMRRRLDQPVRAPTRGRWLMSTTARRLGRAAASPRGIAALARWHERLAARSEAVVHYARLLRALNASMVLATHQRPPEVLAPVLAARALGIPTATFVFSWDNLTSKGRIAAPFEHFLVWSELMRAELLRYYPDVPAERVHVVGTPQFDPYTDPTLLLTREAFCRGVGLDPTRPIICYSGGDAGTCPDDAAYVELLLGLIRDGRVPGRPQVLLRPSPVDPGVRFAALRQRFPELCYLPPAWVQTRPGDWSRVLPLPDDLALLANVTHHSDVNVNVASTMTLDFALHDRPVVNIAFDVTDPPPLGAPLWQVYYQYEHYRPVVELGAARVARSAEELARHVTAYLCDPALDRDARRRLVELEVSLPLGRAAESILGVLHRVSAARPAER